MYNKHGLGNQNRKSYKQKMFLTLHKTNFKFLSIKNQQYFEQNHANKLVENGVTSWNTLVLNNSGNNNDHNHNRRNQSDNNAIENQSVSQPLNSNNQNSQNAQQNDPKCTKK